MNTYHWDHPVLDIVVQMFIDEECIEIENVYAHSNLNKCILYMFEYDALLEDFFRSPEYDAIKYGDAA